MTETTKRILELQKQRGIKNYPLEKAAGLPVSTIQSWVNGKKLKDGSFTPSSPSTEAIVKLARYFNVSADYLLCLSDEPTPLQKADIIKRPDYALSTELAELTQDERFVNSAKLYKELPNKYREEVYALIRGIAIGYGLNLQQILGR